MVGADGVMAHGGVSGVHGGRGSPVVPGALALSGGGCSLLLHLLAGLHLSVLELLHVEGLPLRQQLLPLQLQLQGRRERDGRLLGLVILAHKERAVLNCNAMEMVGESVKGSEAEKERMQERQKESED